MTVADVLDFYRAMESLGTKIWVDGGWGVDALLEKQTRPHDDLDIVIEQKDVAQFRQLLEARGYKEIKLEVARPHNFVMGDDQGHEIDAHVIVLDENGNGTYGPPENGEMYPAASLTGKGRIDQHPVICISPEWVIKFHTGYKLRKTDFQDVSALCHKFGIELPEEYAYCKPDTQRSIDEATEKVLPIIRERQKAKKGPLLIAVDGRSGAGKSTLAQALAGKTGCAIVAGDDFYAGGTDEKWQNLSPQSRADQVVDWTRLRKEVLEPLLAGKCASWHPLAFDPGIGWTGWKDELVTVRPAKVIILDGAYSARPELADIIDVSVLVETADGPRRKRLVAREGKPFMQRWHQLWDPAEDHYFSKIRPKDSFDIVLQME